MPQTIYLDYNATTPLAPEVLGAMRPFLETEFGNPSSSHAFGDVPRRAVDSARRRVAELLGCKPEEIIFTSGGTEANNHAIKSAAMLRADRGKHIITSQIEHPAVLEVFRFLERQGFEATYLPVDETGRVSAGMLESEIRPDTILISIMHSNNEVGTVQPITEIAGIAETHGILMHTDAAQSAGKIRTTTDISGLSLLSIAGHKLYAPKGIGALYIKSGLHLEPFCHGAGQEGGRRAGTENVSMIAGLGKACEIAERDFDKNFTHMQNLRDRLEAEISTEISDAKINGHPEHRLPNTLSISFYELAANRILDEIKDQVAASAGAACHADTVSVSHVLSAMGLDAKWAKGTLRLSTGRMSTEAEVARAAEIITAAGS
ncbi:MAG: cysteine desulfurase family protein [Desulfobacterales bacterium]|nr:cysteine desulfurase family protein [Desulfobacterales bacterium]